MGKSEVWRQTCKVLVLICVLIWENSASSQTVTNANSAIDIRVVAVQGAVEFSTNSAQSWVGVQTNQVLHPSDLLRTGANSRCALLWSDRSVIAFGASTEIQVVPPAAANMQAGLRLIDGIFSFFHRDKPGQIQIITRGAAAGIEGTEFAMAVDHQDKTTVSVIDGAVKIGNQLGTLLITNGQQAEVILGKSPVRSAGFIANDVLQWIFYYPAVLDLNDLAFTAADKKALAGSLADYQSGNLYQALNDFPDHAPDSSPVKIYHAALLLSAGNAAAAEKDLDSLSHPTENEQRLAAAVRQLMAAVKHQAISAGFQPRLASEFLAASYYEQSQAVRGKSLTAALQLARQATVVSPQFALAWERVAEIEFSFGHTKSAVTALNQSLALAPQNPKALVLKGFLLAAQGQSRRAIGVFDQAIAVNPAIGDAWLGRGLCKIRIGRGAQGREDLLIAAAIEPQRSELRSYLGKAFADAGDFKHADKELDLAKSLDPNDPTPWLYSGLLNQERSRINDAIGDVEKSEELNDNRRVYRSDYLLDQDQAVRSANVASMYDDAQMPQVGLNAAGKAINQDYDNYSAHLFLANTYDSFRDPNEVNIRYETPEESEYLLANLLAPADAGTLSPTISQNEYSKLFQRNGFGVASDLQYLSRGAWTESGSQYGTFKDFSYDFESFYRSDPGLYQNNDIYQRQLSLALKMQLTTQDTLYFQVLDYEMTGGDLAQYYSPDMSNPTARVTETERPIVGVGYNHEWAPGVNTLFYFTRLNDRYTATNSLDPQYLAAIPTGVGLTAIDSDLIMDENYTGEANIYSSELQQIFEGGDHTTILGARFQYGHFNTGDLLNNPLNYPYFFPEPIQQFDTSMFRRFDFYGYHNWQILDSLNLVGGLDYDNIHYPANFRNTPISSQEQDEHQVSPKVGFIWTPINGTTFRGAYTRSLQGASIDEAAQIEPSQIAGFIQSYGSIIPGSIVGNTAGAHFETYDVSFQQKFQTRTYLTVSAEMLNSTVNQEFGLFSFSSFANPAQPFQLEQNLDYHERTFLVAINQLLGRDWSLGAQYRWSQASLENNFPTVPSTTYLSEPDPFTPYQKTKGLLNQVDLTVAYNHPSGFFALGEAVWYAQSNSGYITTANPDGEPGDSFWELNAFVGYRSPHRRAQLSIGVLNIGNQDYNLNPLNIYNQMPYKRTLAIDFQFNF